MNFYTTTLKIASLTMVLSQYTIAQGQSNIQQNHTKIVAAIQNLTVDFQQTTYSVFRKKSKTRSGKAYFSKPDSFKWSFSNPQIRFEEFYFDGNTLSHYLKNENVVTHYGVQSGFARELKQVVNMILDPNQLMQTYQTVTVPSQNSQTTTYSLTPKSKQSDVKQITIQIPNSGRIVQGVSIQYSDGNKSTYQFTNPSQSPIPAATFKFSNPGKVKEKRVG